MSNTCFRLEQLTRLHPKAAWQQRRHQDLGGVFLEFYFDSASQEAVVEKLYSSQLKDIQAQELRRLTDAQIAAVSLHSEGKTPLFLQPIDQKIIISTQHSNQSNPIPSDRTRKISIKCLNKGPDLNKWNAILSGENPRPPYYKSGIDATFDNPIFVLTVLKQILLALHQFHLAGFIHCDFKDDNVCIPVQNVRGAREDGSILGDTVSGELQLEKMTIIDLGLSWHRTGKRDLCRHLNGEKSGLIIPGYNATLNQHLENYLEAISSGHPIFAQKVKSTRSTDSRSNYFSDNYLIGCTVSAGIIKLPINLEVDGFSWIDELDWRIDFFSLGVMVDKWTNRLQNISGQYDKASNFRLLTDYLEDLACRFKDFDTPPTQAAPQLPHENIAEEIGVILRGHVEQSSIPFCVLVDADTADDQGMPDFEVLSLESRLSDVEPETPKRALQLPRKKPFNSEIPNLLGPLSGSFLMGISSTQESDASKKEASPAHEVCFSHTFEVGETPVTRREWQLYLKANIDNPNLPFPPLSVEDEMLPITGVSWYEIQSYLTWLNQGQLSTTLQNLQYRLATEAEWEFVCRAGTTSTYSCGSGISKEQACFDQPVVARVKDFAPNPWNFYAMHGTVWEWVDDYWTEDYRRASSKGLSVSVNPTIGQGERKVVRGGSFLSLAHGITSSSRKGYFADFRSTAVGFRLARTIKS
jgi:formylglycine-generating enzyme required for sulfatase activity